MKRVAAALLLLLFIFGWVGSAAAQTTITADVDRTEVAINDQFVLTIAIEGPFNLLPEPDLLQLQQNFLIINRSVSNQVSVVNGQMSAKANYRYVLQPLRDGDLMIPAFSIILDGEPYLSEPIPITVTADIVQATPPTSENVEPPQTPDRVGDNEFFVEAEIDNPNPYLGEQILHTFRFYQALDTATLFAGQLDYQAPPFTDFWSEALAQPQYTAELNGRIYSVTEVRTALFPAGLNEIVIDSARLVVPGGIFNPDTVLESDPIVVNVRSLPPGAPANFNGAVGQFELRASIDRTQTTVNDPVTLRIEIEGEGNIEALTEPSLPDIEGWRRFESETSTSLVPTDSAVAGVRRFERLLVPGQAGEFQIPPISFSYYDPQIDAYQTAITDPLLVLVQPGEDDFTAIAEPVNPIVGEFRTIKPVPFTLDRSWFFTVLNPVYWLCWLIPLFVVGTLWVFQNQRVRLSSDVGYARRTRARRVALRVLKEGEAENADYYAIAQRALLGYISDRLNRPTSGLTTSGLVTLLNEHNVDEALTERVRGLLKQVETSRFAPSNQDVAQTLLTDTYAIINDLEKNLGR